MVKRKGERTIDETRLIEKVRSGNQQALRVLIERYKHHLFKVIFSVVRDETEAEDLTQETFIKMMDALPSYEDQGFKTWLSRIAMNKAIDAKRKKKRHQVDLIEPETLPFVGHSAEEEWLAKEKEQSVSKSIKHLPNNYQGVVEAYYIQGKTYTQIACEYELEEKTVEMRLYRARKWMKENWKEDEF